MKKDPANCWVLFAVEEAVGFEPTVAINYDSFQDCSVRPLRHASATYILMAGWVLTVTAILMNFAFTSPSI